MMEKKNNVLFHQIFKTGEQKTNKLSLKTPKGTEERLYPAVVQLGSLGRNQRD